NRASNAGSAGLLAALRIKFNSNQNFIEGLAGKSPHATNLGECLLQLCAAKQLGDIAAGNSFANAALGIKWRILGKDLPQDLESKLLFLASTSSPAKIIDPAIKSILNAIVLSRQELDDLSRQLVAASTNIPAGLAVLLALWNVNTAPMIDSMLRDRYCA